MNDLLAQNIDSLLTQAQAGEREAFSKIMRLMMNKTVALTYKMTGDKDTAMDLAQETFISAWQNLAGFKKEAKFESWLYRIAMNKSLNFLKRKKQVPLDNYENMQSNDDPSSDYLRKELRNEIISFMRTLPEQQRIVFELHFYKEMTFEEISQMTGKALGTVKTLYREAVIKLRVVAVEKGWQS